ncbi:hypothetical protein MRB76_000015 [Shigella flexneri]|nr:hypothetical protein [Shigella flexneri]EIC3923136.1 hypothetical protein [Salmonella enterica]EIZ9552571.1 hypothetical protein [Shigella flexneri]
MEIKWPESVADERIGRYDEIVTCHTRLHRTLLLLREDDKLREHIQPVSAKFDPSGITRQGVRLTFACTALGKMLIEAAYLHCCGGPIDADQMTLSIETYLSAEGVRKPQVVWEVHRSTLPPITVLFDAVSDSLNEILKEGV